MTDQNFKTSFIPTKPIQTVSKGGKLGISKGNFLNILTLGIFLVTIVITGGVVIYKIYLQKQVSNQIVQLEGARAALDSPLVTEADRLNTRMKNVVSLLDEHLAPSELFALLEKKTLKTVQFNDLTYTVEADGKVKIEASGSASSYEAIVSQSQEYGKSTYLKDILFTDLQPSQTGGVSFNLSGTVDGDLVLYKNRIENEKVEDEVVEEAETVSEGESFEFPQETPEEVSNN